MRGSAKLPRRRYQADPKLRIGYYWADGALAPGRRMLFPYSGVPAYYRRMKTVVGTSYDGLGGLPTNVGVAVKSSC